MRKMRRSQKCLKHLQFSVHQLVPPNQKPNLEISLRSNRNPEAEIPPSIREWRNDLLSKNSPLTGKLSRGVDTEMESEKMNSEV